MEKIKIAIQKSGRLSENSIDLLKECGIKISNGNRKLKTDATNFPMEVLFLRDDDIPQYVEQGVADIGILGENEVWEKDKDVKIVEQLGFGNCRLSLAIPKDDVYNSIDYFNGKRVATSYPKILDKFFSAKGIKVDIEALGGSVEIATGIGLADGIFDIVSTGSTLIMNGLKEVETVIKSQAVLISNKNLSPAKSKLLDEILFRIKAYKNGRGKKYVLLNAPNEVLPDIVKILPGMRSPSILPLADKGWSSVHSVIDDDDFWEIIDELKRHGAEGILVVPIEKMIL
ncbi:MAG: ATP phosphoribosyltransferase [Fermentimonas sp.]|nr:ATP phosphoribosyltransferase [Fermentimonas sp.]NLC85551.1 ATP phosphoribosyltransferase [Bacteroidales bacterium]MDD2930275.1 ATP phosphoribosyltransferase [Fermentimonas sp.]MDD3510378.1 ATP phosphoribosyltransferase [Fermentimonas sp.]MDD4283980.1 ATP phosphoribosyltransferase [Fermentimonas sp.]